MPDIETSELYDKAVLWSLAGVDRENQVVVYDPVEIRCRWENRLREFIGPEGTPIQIDAEVFVDQEIEVRSLLWLGALADLPETPTDIRCVMGIERIPDIQNRAIQRTLMVQKYQNTLPETVGTGT